MVGTKEDFQERKYWYSFYHQDRTFDRSNLWGWGHSAVKNDEGALRTFRETSNVRCYLFFSFQELFSVLNRKMLGTTCWSTKSSLLKSQIVSIS